MTCNHCHEPMTKITARITNDVALSQLMIKDEIFNFIETEYVCNNELCRNYKTSIFLWTEMENDVIL